MEIGILGTGVVGTTLGTKLVSLGHEVMLGSRSAENKRAVAWAAGGGKGASHGTFADAASHGEVLLNCTAGEGSLAALASVEPSDLAGKILIDVSNPLDFSAGMPPLLFAGNDDSLSEQIQRAHPDVKVVKTLNTVSCDLMVDPKRLREPTDLFLSGNDQDAKEQVERWLSEWFGWERFIDLGDISTARGPESYLALWLRMWNAVGTHLFNVRVVT